MCHSRIVCAMQVHLVCMYVHVLVCLCECVQTCCKALWISMPCPQGAGGLARHSPALPLREMSILCLLKFWKAVDMTFTPSYVRAPVYWKGIAHKSNRGHTDKNGQWSLEWLMRIVAFSVHFLTLQKRKCSDSKSVLSAGWTMIPKKQKFQTA